MKNMLDAMDKLAELQSRGVSVAIDDFGTGYSSMAYLQRLSLETLKINQVFFDMVESEQRQIDAKNPSPAPSSLWPKASACRSSPRALKHRAQREFLIDAGADLMQGFLFSEPLTPDELEPLLRAGRISIDAPLAQSA